MGNGQSISAVNGAWITRPFTYKLFKFNCSLPPDCKVAYLIDWKSYSRKTEMLRANVDPLDVDMILRIPLVSATQRDILVWHFSKSGYFSIRSAYHLALNKRMEEIRGSSSSGSSSHVMWKKVWHLKVPHKKRHFLWHALNDYLPTRWKLWNRGIGETGECPRCGFKAEKGVHALLYCPAAIAMWIVSPAGLSTTNI